MAKYDVSVGVSRTFEADNDDEAKEYFLDWLSSVKELIEVREKKKKRRN